MPYRQNRAGEADLSLLHIFMLIPSIGHVQKWGFGRGPFRRAETVLRGS